VWKFFLIFDILLWKGRDKMSIIQERLLEIVETMSEYDDGEKFVFELYKKYIELYGEDDKTEQTDEN